MNDNERCDTVLTVGQWRSVAAAFWWPTWRRWRRRRPAFSRRRGRRRRGRTDRPPTVGWRSAAAAGRRNSTRRRCRPDRCRPPTSAADRPATATPTPRWRRPRPRWRRRRRWSAPAIGRRPLGRSTRRRPVPGRRGTSRRRCWRRAVPSRQLGSPVRAASPTLRSPSLRGHGHHFFS